MQVRPGVVPRKASERGPGLDKVLHKLSTVTGQFCTVGHALTHREPCFDASDRLARRRHRASDFRSADCKHAGQSNFSTGKGGGN